MKKPGHLWLLGLSGSGKSTIGPLLAQLVKMSFVDTDEIITQKARRSISEIFRLEGEAGFRKREAGAIREIGPQKPAVVACGGGAILEAGNRIAMQGSGTRIYLRVPMEILEARLHHKKDRPLLAQGSLTNTLADQLAKRKSWYEESEIQINAGDASPEQVAQQIFERWTSQS